MMRSLALPAILALNLMVARAMAQEPYNVPDGIILPQRVEANSLYIGQRVEILFPARPNVYFRLQYADCSAPLDWQYLQDLPISTGMFVDDEGVPGRMYRSRGVTGQTTTLKVMITPGLPSNDTVSVFTPFYPTWQYILERRTVPEGNSLRPTPENWASVASSHTNSHFFVERIPGQEYRIRAKPPVDREDYEAILVAGQSNALLSDNLYSPDRVGPVVYLSDYAEHYCEFLHPARFGGLRGPFVFSFSVGAATELSDLSTRKYLLVPVAVGGTSMKQWMPTSNRFDRDTLFGRANYRRVLGSPAGLKAIWYYGHESSVTPLADYIQNWRTLMAEFRKETGRIPIIFAQLAKNGKAEAHELARLAAERQRLTESGQAAAIIDSHMVVTFDLPLADGLHLAAEGQRILGHRFALATRQHIYHEDVNGTGPRLLSIRRNPARPKIITLSFDRSINSPTNQYDNQFRITAGVTQLPIAQISRGSDSTQIHIELGSAPPARPVVEYGYPSSAGNDLFLTNVIRDLDGLPAPVFGPLLVNE